MKPIAAGAGIALVIAVAHAADLPGTWALESQRNGGDAVYQVDCSFKQERERPSGSCISGFESLVPVTGNATGTTGTWRFVDERGNKGDGTFTAAKR